MMLEMIDSFGGPEEFFKFLKEEYGTSADETKTEIMKIINTVLTRGN